MKKVGKGWGLCSRISRAKCASRRYSGCPGHATEQCNKAHLDDHCNTFPCIQNEGGALKRQLPPPNHVCQQRKAGRSYPLRGWVPRGLHTRMFVSDNIQNENVDQPYVRHDCVAPEPVWRCSPKILGAGWPPQGHLVGNWTPTRIELKGTTPQRQPPEQQQVQRRHERTDTPGDAQHQEDVEILMSESRCDPPQG